MLALALGVVVGAPGVAALTAKLPRRRLVLILLGRIAAALNQSALNTANAGGAAVGGLVVGAGLGFGSTALAGAALSVTAVVFCVVAARLARSSAR